MRKKTPQTKEQKRARLGQSLMIAGFMVIGGVCGLMMVPFLESMDGVPGGFWLGLAALVLLLYAVIAVQILLHEAGHLVCGLLSGYRFSSFRVFGLMLVRTEGRLRLRRLTMAGTGGQCLMDPPDMVNGTLPVTLYNLGGPLANLLVGLVCLGGAFFASGPLVLLTLRMMALVGFAFALINGLPLTVGPIDNDGKNALSLRGDPHALRAFWAQMKMAATLAQDVRLKDMPQAWFIPAPGADLKNTLVASQAVFNCNRLMDQGLLAGADRAMATLLSGQTGMLELHRTLLRRERAFLEMIGPNRPEVLAQLYTAGDTKLLKSMRGNPSVLRTEYAHALLVQKDAKKAAALYAAFEKAARSHPYPCEIAGERELLTLAQTAAQAPAAAQ